MPVLQTSEYRPLGRYRYTHLQTVLPTLLRKVEGVSYNRERMSVGDGDFIDLDFLSANSKSAVILCHGLEGCSDRAYMKGMAKAFSSRGVDAVCYNYRGCSGEPNLRKKMYTAGSTDDLQDVLDYVYSLKKYSNIFLVGFSLGANLILKYAGEKGSVIDQRIKGIVAVSAPCDLYSSSMALHSRRNLIYHKRFLLMLSEKIEEKKKIFPELSSIDLSSIRTMSDFDNLITAPLNGFKDAEDYWKKCSSLGELNNIIIPTLVLNAADDTILGPECYPFAEAEKSDYIFLEVPKKGGHVGFMRKPSDEEYWHEKRAVDFLQASTKLF